MAHIWKPSSYSHMSIKTGISERELSTCFSNLNFNHLRVVDLKELIRYLRGLPAFRSFSGALRLNGRKSHLVEGLLIALGSAGAMPQTPAAPVYSNNVYNPNYYGMSVPHRPAPHHVYQHSKPTPPLTPDQLANLPSFLGMRNPFHKFLRILNCAYTGPLSTAHLHFSLNYAQLARLKLPNVKRPASTWLVHLRLFTAAQSHREWEKTMSLSVNGHWIKLPDLPKLSKAKKRAHQVCKPLDITAYMKESNHVELIPSSGSFTGWVLAELVEERTCEQLMAVTKNRGPAAAAAARAAAASGAKSSGPLLPMPQTCAVCPETKNLLRCSRCKDRWYCGPAHQKVDWKLHRRSCVVSTPAMEEKRAREKEKALKEAAAKISAASATATTTTATTTTTTTGDKADDDDEIQEVDSRMSIVCPLSIDRIEVCARGLKCTHKRCFDLETYLLFCSDSGLWQCPVCSVKLPYEELLVDEPMNKLIKDLPEEVTQIRMDEKGGYVAVMPRTKNVNRGASDAGDGPAKRQKVADTRPPVVAKLEQQQQQQPQQQKQQLTAAGGGGNAISTSGVDVTRQRPPSPLTAPAPAGSADDPICLD